MAELSANIGEAVVGGTIGGATWEQTGQPADPWWLTTLEDIPGIGTATLFTMNRGANTIIGGGWGDEPTKFRKRMRNTGTDTFFGGSLKNNNFLRRRSWRRYGSQEIFHGNEGQYTPFQFVARGGNWIGGRLAKSEGTIATAMRNRGLLEEGGELISRGGLARLSAGSRIQNMSAARYAKRAASTQKFLVGAGFDAKQIALIKGQGQRAVGQAVAMSGRGTVSNAIAGFLQGGSRGGMDPGLKVLQLARGLEKGPGAAAARAAMRGYNLAEGWGMQAAEAAGKDFAKVQAKRIGVKTAGSLIRHGGLRGAGYVGARVAGFALKAAHPIGWALLAYDLAKLTVNLTGSAIKGGVRLASDAVTSLRGGMNTGIMEQGFKDNTVTITSRQRGVAAIQNSRLNARSVLGAEAGPIHAHFG